MTSGTIRRAMDLVRTLASTGSRGRSLTELAKGCGLPHPTAHRLLRSLIREGLVRQDESTRRYTLGRFAYELGVAAEVQFDIRDWCYPVVARLAQEVGETIYLSVRSGIEVVCVYRHDGPISSKVMTIEIGNRRPLGIGAGGLAILAALPAGECDEILASIDKHIGNYRGLTTDDVRTSVDATRKTGYALIRNRVVLGETLTGVCFKDARARPIGAISLAGINQRMSADRIPSIAAHLREAARQIESGLPSKTARLIMQA